MNEELREELLRLVGIDQDARKRVIKLMGLGLVREPTEEQRRALDELAAVDAANTAWLRQVIDDHGWPGISLVGEDGAHAAWLLAQHADRDVAFQRRCLDLLTQAVEQNEASPRDLAYLTDRVLLAEGEEQVYGTQFEVVEGFHRPRRLGDPDAVDERRRSVGLGTLAGYAAGMGERYGKPGSGR